MEYGYVDKQFLFKLGGVLLQHIVYLARLLEEIGFISRDEIALIMTGIYILERRRRYSYKELKRLLRDGWRLLAPVSWRRARYMARKLSRELGVEVSARRIYTEKGEGYIIEVVGRRI